MWKKLICGECAWVVDTTGVWVMSNAIAVEGTLEREPDSLEVLDPEFVTDSPCEMCDESTDTLFHATFSDTPVQV